MFKAMPGILALLVALPTHAGLIVAVVVMEISYVFDASDGQLARLRGTSTPVGAHFDFLVDELKAFMLVAATGIRLWSAQQQSIWLVEALVGLLAVASAISLTTFIRRPEYTAATGTRPPAPAGDYGDGFAATEAPAPSRTPLAKVLGLVEAFGRLCIPSPTYLPLVALTDSLDVFLHVYVAIHLAYGARTLAGVALKLGRL
jgi:hypothetical protein